MVNVNSCLINAVRRWRHCLPLEQVYNVLPPTLVMILQNSCVATSWLMFLLAILNILKDSGYHLPGLLSPEAHDFHHLKFTECYGVLGILDYLHGTDRLFRSSAAYDRHIVSFKLEPVRQLYPDI